MNIMAFDTFAAVTRLKDAGFTEAQAKGVVETFRDVDTSEVATKGDIKDVKSEIKDLRGEMQAEFRAVRSEAQAFRVEMQNEFKAVRAEMREMELRLQAQIKDQTIKTGAMIFALGGMLVAIKFLG